MSNSNKCPECGTVVEAGEADAVFETVLTDPESFSETSEFHCDVNVTLSCPECGEELAHFNGETCFEVELGEG